MNRKIACLLLLVATLAISLPAEPAGTEAVRCTLTLQNGQKVSGTVPADLVAFFMFAYKANDRDENFQENVKKLQPRNVDLTKIRSLEWTKDTVWESVSLPPGSGCGGFTVNWNAYKLTFRSGDHMQVRLRINLNYLDDSFPKCYDAIPLTTASGVKSYPLQVMADNCTNVQSADGGQGCIQCKGTCPAVDNAVRKIDFMK